MRSTKWRGLAPVLAMALAHDDYQPDCIGVELQPYMCDIVNELFGDDSITNDQYLLYRDYWAGVNDFLCVSLVQLLMRQDVVSRGLSVDFALRLRIGRAYWGAVAERAKTAGNITALHNAGKSAVRELIL